MEYEWNRNSYFHPKGGNNFKGEKPASRGLNTTLSSSDLNREINTAKRNQSFRVSDHYSIHFNMTFSKLLLCSLLVNSSG